MNSEIHIAHLTSAHPRFDTRIFLKQCRSLARAGYEVALVVADGMGDEVREEVAIHDVGAPSGRLDRMRNVTRRVLAKAVQLDAYVYHLHDPELLPVGLKLKKLGKLVIFDAHEDVPKQLMGKPYLNPLSRWSLSRVFASYEAWACHRLDGIIAATPFIRDKFLASNPNTVDINNFPLLGELTAGEIDWSRKQHQVAYVGGIARIRGILEVVAAVAQTRSDVRLQLVGKFSEVEAERQARASPGWSRTDALGFLDREGVRDVLQRAVAGLVTFLPMPNHIDAQPNKMFEYMSAGVPVIASHFPLWREIVEGNQCGLCVDPLQPAEISQAMDHLLSHPQEAEQMGRNGQKAVQERYNWGIEEKKLLAFYNILLTKEEAPL